MFGLFVLRITEDKTLGTYLKFPLQLLRIVTERKGEDQIYTEIFFLSVLLLPANQWMYFFRHSAFPSLERERHAIVLVLSGQFSFNYKLIKGFDS